MTLQETLPRIPIGLEGQEEQVCAHAQRIVLCLNVNRLRAFFSSVLMLSAKQHGKNFCQAKT